MSDYRVIADGLFPSGQELPRTKTGRDEVRAAVEALLRIVDRGNARLVLALEQLDKGAAEIERLRRERNLAVEMLQSAERELAAVRHHLEAAYEAMGVPLIMSRPLSCYINDLRKELAAERAARIAIASPVRREGE